MARLTDDLFLPTTRANPAAPKPKCRRHIWTDATIPASCSRCNQPRDDARVRLGKSARRLGGDQERRIERIYGPRKVGEYGDPVDHLGRDWKWQSKATREAKPLWLSAVLLPTWRETVPAWVITALERMEPYHSELKPVVIRSYVRRGVRPEDYLFIRGYQWPMQQRASGYWVIPGTDWLDYLGTDHPGRIGDELTLDEVAS